MSKVFKIPKLEDSESKEVQNMYYVYRVELAFRDMLLGGVPTDPNIIDKWLESKKKPDLTTPEAIAKEKEDIEEEEGLLTTFKKDEGGLYIEGRQIVAMMKDAVKSDGFSIGHTNAIKYGLIVRPNKIRLIVNGSPAQKPDGYVDMVGHVSTPKGDRSVLNRADYVRHPKAGFDIWIVKSQGDTRMAPSSRLTPKVIHHSLMIARELGLGAKRTQGQGDGEYGRFEVERLELLNPPVRKKEEKDASPTKG